VRALPIRRRRHPSSSGGWTFPSLYSTIDALIETLTDTNLVAKLADLAGVDPILTKHGVARSNQRRRGSVMAIYVGRNG
jgi:hypothetical protein